MSGILAYKFFIACKDLQIVSGRDLTEFSHCDQTMIKRCLQMSSIAYENLTEFSPCDQINPTACKLKIKDSFFDDIFRSCPTNEEHNEGHRGRLKMYILSFYCFSAIINFWVFSLFATLPVKIWQKCLETDPVALRFASPNSPLVFLNICRVTIDISVLTQAVVVFSYQNKIKGAYNKRPPWENSHQNTQVEWR